MTDETLPAPVSIPATTTSSGGLAPPPVFGKVGLPSEPEELKFSYVPRSGLWKLMFVNLLLNIVTLGFYRFWAKTNIRRHVWSCVHINGEPLEYTGTGKEKFMGFLIVFGTVLLPFILINAGLNIYLGPQNPALAAVQFIFALFIYVMWGFAVYRSLNYMLSRTNWRGIRGALVGSAMTYSLLFFGSMLAKGMSMGWATPVMNTVLQEQLVSDMRFGDAAFKFKGRAGPLYPTYALCWILMLAAFIAAIVAATGFASSFGNLKDLFKNAENSENAKAIAGAIITAIALLLIVSLLVIPLIWSIYTAKELRTFATYTRFDGAPFTLRASAWSVIVLAVINLLLLVLTLGIARPFIVQRTVRFFISRLSLEGKIDVDRIRQSEAKMLKRGEGMLEAFDIGGFLGGI